MGEKVIRVVGVVGFSCESSCYNTILSERTFIPINQKPDEGSS